MFCFRSSVFAHLHSPPKIRLTTFQVYDAINDDVELPNIDYPDSDASKAIIEFHACEFSGTSQRIIVYLYFGLFSWNPFCKE